MRLRGSSTLIPQYYYDYLWAVGSSSWRLICGWCIAGLMLATLYGIYVLIRVNINPAMAPTAEEVTELAAKR